MTYLIPNLIFWYQVWRGAFITMLIFYHFKTEHFFPALILCFFIFFILDVLYSNLIVKEKHTIRWSEILNTILGIILGITCIFNIVYGFILVFIYYIILAFKT